MQKNDGGKKKFAPKHPTPVPAPQAPTPVVVPASKDPRWVNNRYSEKTTCADTSTDPYETGPFSPVIPPLPNKRLTTLAAAKLDQSLTTVRELVDGVLV